MSVEREWAERPGVVFLVAAGPGEPDLITVRGRRLVRRCDVLVHERGIDAALIAEASTAARVLPAGAATASRRLVSELARAGLRVVWLRSDASQVRALADAAALRAGGVGVEVVPGVAALDPGVVPDYDRKGRRHGFRWTREMIIYAIDLWHRRHLRIPTVMEWDRAGADHPCRATVSRVFGSWDAAIHAAGFQPRGRGESRLDRRRFRDVTTGELLDVPQRPPNSVPTSEFHGGR